ncbi:SAS complex subunit [Saxophila tyrrhenica]|uniref:histone acetyltransferase n=1 Tax=Saxophila tyrrhenica TaxID=1690608 RepID=A0AAV9P8Q6_9PEZI|nr:SAS complex subunit [Saxophila tyrrhenica]
MAVTTPAAPVLTSPHRSANTAPSSNPMPPNIANAVLGNLHMKPWYPSFYPEDMIGGRKTDWLYVCQWCFKYTSEIMKFCGHCAQLYAQNLSLFSKLFLETKSVFFDASTFLYYTLVLRPEPTDPKSHGQVVGFFSKEKMSWDNNNVACILVFPPWQRRGLGQILIAASYELGKREERFGGPERPLSALGLKGYLAFWSGEVARWILGTQGKRSVGIKEISDATWILPEDVVAALVQMDVMEKRKTASGNVVVSKGKVRAWADKTGVRAAPLIDVDAFVEAEDVEYEDDEDDDG